MSKLWNRLPQNAIQTPDHSSILRRHLMSKLTRRSKHGKTPSPYSPPAWKILKVESPPTHPPTFFCFITSLLYSVVPCAALFSSYCILMDPLWLKLFRSLWFFFIYFFLVHLIVLPLAPNSAHSSKCLIWTILSVARAPPTHHIHPSFFPLPASPSPPPPPPPPPHLSSSLLFFPLPPSTPPLPPHSLSGSVFIFTSKMFPGTAVSNQQYFLSRSECNAISHNWIKTEGKKGKKDDGEEEGNRLCQHELKK